MDLLAEQFEANRRHLRAVAYRMLGSINEADDAVQEAWLRLSRSDANQIENLGGWLTTVVSRVCLDMLRSRKGRREDPLSEIPVVEPIDPEEEAVRADSVGQALLVVLDALAPAERLAFVLHDLFAVPYEEIAPIVGRTPAAARQLASRARRRVQASDAPDADRARQRELVDAFLAASRAGEFDRLLALLDPDAVLRVDGAAARMGAQGASGADPVAHTFSGRAKAAQPALIDGLAGAVWAMDGVPKVVFDFTVVGDKIVAIDLLADPELLSELELVVTG
jgi:RNA polymerase sigma factor (sigma-70 family)